MHCDIWIWIISWHCVTRCSSPVTKQSLPTRYSLKLEINNLNSRAKNLARRTGSNSTWSTLIPKKLFYLFVFFLSILSTDARESQLSTFNVARASHAITTSGLTKKTKQDKEKSPSSFIFGRFDVLVTSRIGTNQQLRGHVDIIDPAYGKVRRAVESFLFWLPELEADLPRHTPVFVCSINFKTDLYKYIAGVLVDVKNI